MTRRRRALKAKPGELVSWYGVLDRHSGRDLCVAWQAPAMKGDSGVILDGLKPLCEELEKSGYDLSTMKFTIKKEEIAA